MNCAKQGCTNLARFPSNYCGAHERDEADSTRIIMRRNEGTARPSEYIPHPSSGVPTDEGNEE